ncbi:sugar ABC transporter substrate-binding protein [Tautonia plasticadhaerens]|uniref:Periplasmic binding protein domain-containing protein n=1 Tax=Tautonia plasticadhaerens TaxID=2527974 RepID=A0A518GXC7_9BACT|nr:substrate-binding domain-containing protein [Tautonia plasticadhaerens]QDV33254.1 hypothetical protein ElP_10970 [Tautonia plasticadhaerens]
MTRSVVTIPAGLAISLMLLVGCGESGPAEKAPGGDQEVASLADLVGPPAASVGARRITMILPSESDPRHEIWEEAARRESARLGVVFSSRIPAEGERVADLLLRSIREGGSALIVVSDEGGGLGSASAEARVRGVAVVTLLEPSTIEGDPVPAVVRGELGTAAGELVAAAVEDASKLGKPASGPALVAFIPDFPEANQRAGVLFEAAREAGIELIGDEPFAAPTDEPARTEAIRGLRASHPGLSMVLAGDDASLISALSVRNEGTDADRFVIAGFVINSNQLEFVKSDFVSAVAFADEQVLGIYAVRTVLDLDAGEEVPDRIVTPLPVLRATGPPAPIPSLLDPEVELPPGLRGGAVKPRPPG